MAYYPDPAPCDYGGPIWRADDELAVGWLSIHHPFTTGDFPAELLDRLSVLATKPVRLFSSKHSCDICPPPVETRLASRPTSLRRGRVERRLEQLPNGEVRDEWVQWERTDHVVFVSGQEIDVGNGEIRIADEDGLVFAAPTMILHYIVEHRYLPPDAFIEASDLVVSPRTHWRRSERKWERRASRNRDQGVPVRGGCHLAAVRVGHPTQGPLNVTDHRLGVGLVPFGWWRSRRCWSGHTAGCETKAGGWIRRTTTARTPSYVNVCTHGYDSSWIRLGRYVADAHGPEHAEANRDGR